MVRRILLSSSIVLVLAFGSARAQDTAALDLLRRVPDDLGICLAVNDLHGHVARWERSAWWPRVRDNVLVQSLLKSNEVRDLKRFEEELQRHLQIDFAFLRDDILGEAFVFAYQPASKSQGSDERGLLLIKARKAESLASLVEKVNELQTNLGELTALEERKHKTHVYHRRVHQRATHYYSLNGPILAISSREDVLRAMLDRGPAEPSPRRDQVARAGLGNAVATLWINPRVLDEEMNRKGGNGFGLGSIIYPSLKAFWKGLDGVLVSAHGDESLELRLTLLANSKSDLHQRWSEPTPPAIAFWNRTPDNALLRAAVPIDFARLAKSLRDVASENDVQQLDRVLEKSLGAATGLDVFRDILPNLGPDVGIALLKPRSDGLPPALIAIAAKPNPTEAPVDQTLLKAAQLFAGLAIFDYNRKNEEPIRVRTLQQDGIEIRYLTHAKLFPPGLQPALALKDGYLILASTPDAIADFQKHPATTTADTDMPLFKIATREWSRLVKLHRQKFVDHLVRKNGDPPATAEAVVDGLADAFDIFPSLTLSQRTGQGQAVWSLRLSPAK